MPKRLRDNPLNQDQAKTKRSYDNYLRPFFERTAEEHSMTIDPDQSEVIKVQEKSRDSVDQSLKTYGISADEFYIDYDSDDNDDSEDLL